MLREKGYESTETRGPNRFGTVIAQRPGNMCQHFALRQERLLQGPAADLQARCIAVARVAACCYSKRAYGFESRAHGTLPDVTV